MQHIKCRCKHCQKIYYFCTYGNGPSYGTESGCSQEYCGECQTAITEALSKIPVRFKPKFKEIIPSLGIDSMLGLIKEVKIKELGTKKMGLGDVVCYSDSEGYDNVETYNHTGKTFRIEWNDDTPNEKHYFIKMEWDVEKKGYTGNHWESDNYYDTYSFHRSMKPLISELMAVTANPLPKPTGELFSEPFEWDLVTKPDKTKKKCKLNKWTGKHTGAAIKGLLDYGRQEYKVVLAEGLSRDDLIDVLEYKTEHQRYDGDGEKIETITKIEIV